MARNPHRRLARGDWSQQPNPLGFSSLLGGPNGSPTTADDFGSVTRETLVRLYDNHDTVTGVIGPRNFQHVGLEDSFAFGGTIARNTANVAPFGIIAGTAATVHDALWEWLNRGGPHLPQWRLDRAAGARSTLFCSP